jgi:hypothetical protein
MLASMAVYARTPHDCSAPRCLLELPDPHRCVSPLVLAIRLAVMVAVAAAAVVAISSVVQLLQVD